MYVTDEAYLGWELGEGSLNPFESLNVQKLQGDATEPFVTKIQIISRKPQYKDVYRRTIGIPQRTRISTVDCCLKDHNAHLKLASPISG